VEGASDYYPGGYPDEVPEFSSTVSSFALDKYEVTVGRFRKFVEAYVGNGVDGGAATVPAEGAGANPNIPGSGWQSAWNGYLPATQAAFKDTLNCNATFQTWTDTAASNENLPIDCVQWYEAFAFCIWDGGRLPTESEWEYTAAGGAENRLYPWGSTTPDCTYANSQMGTYPNWYYCPGGVFPDLPVAVGSKPKGDGRWGHADLAGNVLEFALDAWPSTYTKAAVTNYANLSGEFRALRGEGQGAEGLRAAYRAFGGPDYSTWGVGLRCARPVQ
jgi:formylglycine-generating enzyme required for sulfatase activity